MSTLGAALEPAAPLEMSANRWIATSIARKTGPTDTESPEPVVRKVRSLLNKLTTEKFDSISDQIIDWANKSENERDGRTLIQVVRLVFEYATYEATWSEMYAHLCRKMMETISPEVQDDGIRNPEGKPIAGGQLFRKYLLNRCQEDFERGWSAKEATVAVASDDQAIKTANEKGYESELYSDEYHAAQKAKRRGLGLITFIGELFKLQMLTERIMHECVKKLLGNVESPEEEEIESLCQLLRTVGRLLDVPKARAHIDVYFTRMKELCKSLKVSSRLQFMLQDMIELRDRKWVARGAVITPTTLSAVHEAAARKNAVSKAQSYRRLNMSGGRLRHSGERATEPGLDGWGPVRGLAIRSQPKADDSDLSQFGETSKAATMVMEPSSVFTKKDAKWDSLPRPNTNSNTFSMLSQGGGPEAPERKELQFPPRTNPSSPEEVPRVASEDDVEPVVQMSEADAKRIDEDAEELKLGSSQNERTITSLTSQVEEWKRADSAKAEKLGIALSQVDQYRQALFDSNSQLAKLQRQYEAHSCELGAICDELQAEISYFESGSCHIQSLWKRADATKTEQTTTITNQVERLRLDLIRSTAQLAQLRGCYEAQCLKLDTARRALKGGMLSSEHNDGTVTAQIGG